MIIVVVLSILIFVVWAIVHSNNLGATFVALGLMGIAIVVISAVVAALV